MKKLIVVGILFLTVCSSVGIAGVPCAILPAPVGWSMIANPCDGGVTTVDVFLPTAPEGTMLFKFNGAFYDMELCLGGGFWEPGVMTLSPGEGAFIFLPEPAALGFEGVPLVGPNVMPLPAGYSICSPPSGLGMLAFPADDGDMIYQYVPASGTFDFYVFDSGLWFPAEPVIGVGESFWVVKVAPAVWVQ